jgi:hypothetical protein
VIFEPGKHLFLDISSANTDTPVPSFCQCVETRSIEVFWLLSQPLPHLRFIIWEFRTSLRISRLICRALSFKLQTLPTINTKYSLWIRSHLLTLVPRSRIFLPWRWRRYVPPIRRFTQDLHGDTSQKTTFFIVTAAKTSNLTPVRKVTALIHDDVHRPLLEYSRRRRNETDL